MPNITLPILSAIRFVHQEMTHLAEHRKLFADQRHGGVFRPYYTQKIAASTPVRIQWGSDHTTNAVKIYTDKGVLHETLTAVKKVQYRGVTGSVMGVIDNSTAEHGNIIEVSNQQYPGFIKVGNTVTVSGDGVGFTASIIKVHRGPVSINGNTEIVVNNMDPLDVPTLVTVSSTYDQKPYDLYEVDIQLEQYGHFYAVIEGTTGGVTQKAISEPIEVTDNEDMKLIQFTSEGERFGVNYDTGIVHRVWVTARLFQSIPGGEKVYNRESNDRLVLYDDHVTELLDLEVFGIPPYLSKLLNMALVHDFFFIEGVQYQSEEVPEPEYFLPNPLCNLRVRVEEVMPEDGVISNGSGGNILMLDQGQLKTNEKSTIKIRL